MKAISILSVLLLGLILVAAGAVVLIIELYGVMTPNMRDAVLVMVAGNVCVCVSSFFWFSK